MLDSQKYFRPLTIWETPDFSSCSGTLKALMCMVYRNKRTSTMRGETLIESCRQKSSTGVQKHFSSLVPVKVWVIIMPLRKWHCPTYLPANEMVKFKGKEIAVYLLRVVKSPFQWELSQETKKELLLLQSYYYYYYDVTFFG